ncbi:MAG: Na(+)-translocating NADH-quinone reductase subunit A [Planctomycetes bacterium]|nr:Na(+)-translocating NADH-quinone reductase subunit A [Planctomycetota bacterium]
MSAQHFKIRKGLDLPITGAPKQEISAARDVTQVGLLGANYHGMKPTMLVQIGDRVKRGQPLFEDKKTPGVLFASPAAGEVVAIHRGDKRVFHSVVVRCDGDDAAEYRLPGNKSLESATRDEVRDLLVASGQWIAFRTRPYSKTPAVDAAPTAIFVSAMDTSPLAADPLVVIGARADDFRLGVLALTKLTAGDVFLSSKAGAQVPGSDVANVRHASFDGPHPAGLVGTHIHYLRPASLAHTAWTIGYQDVIALGALFRTGTIDATRVVSLAGPAAKEPRLVKTILGAKLADLCAGEIADPSLETRIVSGSVLCGDKASGELADVTGFLGRFHVQVTLLREGRQREFLGWHMPGGNRYSIKNVYVSALNRAKKFAFTTNTNGSPRAMVPVGSYEAVMPLDILPTQLLRALLSKDTDTAQQLGVLELDEEDLGLCTFVDPGKTDFPHLLRESLTMIERDG